MREEDRMKYLDEIEDVAILAGFETRREMFRSLEVVQVFDNGVWCYFDPINQAKDVAKLLYALAKMDGFEGSELDFRLIFIREALNHAKSNAVS